MSDELSAHPNVLAVDLDGTLLRSDLLLESGLAFIRKAPLRALQPLMWLISGRARLKARLAEEVALDVAMLPYDRQTIDLLEAERARGREIVLATASYRSYADQVADHLRLFDRVMATDRDTNLSSGNKRDALVREFGEKGFDYVGNSLHDLPVWAAARNAYVVNPEPGVESRVRALGNLKLVIKGDAPGLGTWIRALRIHQWLKNALIFVPLLSSHRLGDLALFGDGVLAFLLFGLCASSVYLLNDLLDLEDDRHHARKRHRPFASGTLSIKAGLALIPVLLAVAFLGAALVLPWPFIFALVAYYGLTLAYSLILKRVMMLDVVTLALLYTSRIVAGTLALELTLTFWMLAFSVFMFLSLALVKRYAELRDARMAGTSEKTRGRGYYPDDLEMISSLGAAAGYCAVLVLALYIQDEGTVELYRHPQAIWLACPLLLFWISRTWLLTHRGQMHDDPVLFAVKDRVSLTIGVLFGAVFWLAA
ncbi:MAG: UbiA family prenyltransferase [Chromatiaceae bacterium]|nr:UbiA family prenyltransferase [Chromatiaceae bacterium]